MVLSVLSFESVSSGGVFEGDIGISTGSVTGVDLAGSGNSVSLTVSSALSFDGRSTGVILDGDALTSTRGSVAGDEDTGFGNEVSTVSVAPSPSFKSESAGTELEGSALTSTRGSDTGVGARESGNGVLIGSGRLLLPCARDESLLECGVVALNEISSGAGRHGGVESPSGVDLEGSSTSFGAVMASGMASGEGEIEESPVGETP